MCVLTHCQGLNNFSSMPLLPGAEAPVALSSAQVKRKAVKAKAKPKGKVQGADNGAGSASGSSKRDRDDELLQLDLKREQIKTFQRAVSQLRFPWLLHFGFSSQMFNPICLDQSVFTLSARPSLRKISLRSTLSWRRMRSHAGAQWRQNTLNW